MKKLVFALLAGGALLLGTAGSAAAIIINDKPADQACTNAPRSSGDGRVTRAQVAPGQCTFIVINDAPGR